MAEPPLRHAWLRALGPDEMPQRIMLADGAYAHVRTFKHDFFAATGLYEGPSGRVILKVGRVASLFGLPMRWLGRWLSGRERAIYQAIDDLPGVPRCLGRWGETGLLHAYVEGHPLQRNERVDDEFFPRLQRLLAEMHRRHIAYVDLEKRENILVDADGRPCLIDFQISWQWPAGENGPRRGLQRLISAELGRFVLARLQEGDRYHVLKHRRRHRPDELTRAQLEASYRGGAYVNLHRRLVRPLLVLRRGILKLLTGRSRSPNRMGRSSGERRVPCVSEARVCRAVRRVHWERAGLRVAAKRRLAGADRWREGEWMSLDDRARQIVREFRAWIESAAGGELGFTAAHRHDRRDESTLATRWDVDRHLWHEIAVRPFLPQVRVAILTDDRWRSRDLEQMIEDSSLTLQEFVALGLEAAGLPWPEPPVEHYCEWGRYYYFATPLDLKSIEQLAEPARREKTRKILSGYRHAFFPTSTA